MGGYGYVSLYYGGQRERLGGLVFEEFYVWSSVLSIGGSCSQSPSDFSFLFFCFLCLLFPLPEHRLLYTPFTQTSSPDRTFPYVLSYLSSFPFPQCFSVVLEILSRKLLVFNTTTTSPSRYHHYHYHHCRQS